MSHAVHVSRVKCVREKVSCEVFCLQLLVHSSQENTLRNFWSVINFSILSNCWCVHHNVLHAVVLDLFRYASVVCDNPRSMNVDIFSAARHAPVSSCFASFHIVDSLLITKTATLRSSTWSLTILNNSLNVALQISRSSPILIVTANMLG